MGRIRHHVKQVQCFCTTWDMMIITARHNSILNELQILYHASILLKKKLATVKGLKVPQPRSQTLPSCGGKTLVGAGHVTHRKLIA